MKKIFAMSAAILLSATVCVDAQRRSDTNITGHTVDVNTGEHLIYSTITIKGTTIGTVTDATGHYHIRHLDAGQYTVTASAIGYETAEKTVTLTHGKTHEVDFELKPSNVSIDQVVVSANRTETNRLEAPTIVSVVSGLQFEQTASNSLSDALNFQSGLRVEMNCGNCGLPQLRINGLEGQYSQILIDSRPIMSSLAAVYGLEQMPVGMIERVEVIRGGGSALFGANAIGGVVNIITKDPKRNTVSLSNNTGFMGSSADVNTTLNGSFITDDFRGGVYLFGMIRNRDKYDRDGDGFSEIPRLKSETIGFRGFYNTSNYSRLTVEYHHIREFRRGGDRISLPPHESDLAEELRHGINSGAFTFDIFSKDSRQKASVYSSFQYIDRSSYFGAEQTLDAYGRTKDATLVSGAQYSFGGNKFLFSPYEFTAGIEATVNKLRDKILGYGRNFPQDSYVVGGFAQNEWKSEQFNLIAGFRLDKHKFVDNPVFSPRISLRYTPTSSIILRAGYSSGYRAPQAYDEDLHVGAVGGTISIIELDPDLKPEYSHSLTASTDLYAVWGSVHANLLIEGFYTRLKDVFVLTDNGIDANGNLLFIRENAQGATVGGINLEGKLALSDNNYLQVGYTWQRSRYKDPFQWSDDPAARTTKKMLRSPDNYGYFTIGCEPVKYYTLNLNGTYTGGMLAPHFAGYIPEDKLEKTRSFFELGFRAARSFRFAGTGNIEISGGIKNIFDTFQKDMDKGFEKDGGYIYGPSLPRTFFFGAKFEF